MKYPVRRHAFNLEGWLSNIAQPSQSDDERRRDSNIPGESTDHLLVDGSYSQGGSNLTLTFDSETSNWLIAVEGAPVTLTARTGSLLP